MMSLRLVHLKVKQKKADFGKITEK